jgi:UDP-3-O-acyl-N-acetylglucosamine deacetylase
VNQKTIAQPVALTGIGLHTGAKAQATFKPADVNQGVRFIRVDLPGQPVVRVSPETAVMDVQISRCTAVEEAGVRIYTIEHLLAALSGLGIDNVTVEIDADEVPGMDGSSLDFVAALKKAGLVEQNAPRQYITVKYPVSVQTADASVTIVLRINWSMIIWHYLRQLACRWTLKLLSVSCLRQEHSA